MAGKFVEVDGMVVIEAENFLSQMSGSNGDFKQTWRVIKAGNVPKVRDKDGPHFNSASAKVYVEALPDEKQAHGPNGRDGEKPGLMDNGGGAAILTYEVDFLNAGDYRFWVRMFISDTESNSLHLGINDDWPTLGERVEGCQRNPECNNPNGGCKYYKQTGPINNAWMWVKTRREPHNGCFAQENMMAMVTVENPGVHIIKISMREDGAELDKFILTQDLDYKPTGEGPEETSLTE